MTGVAFIDLSAAYDTVNHKPLAQKVYKVTKDYTLTRLIGCLLQDRRFFVVLHDKNSRWRTQKNGLAQGSVLAPILFNIYTDDQPLNSYTKKFIYADDTAVTAQDKTFEEVEGKLIRALEELAIYHKNNDLRPNPSISQVGAFHLRNRQVKRKLNVSWKEQELEHCDTPK